MLGERNINVLDGLPIWSACSSGQGLEGVGKVDWGRSGSSQNFGHQVSGMLEGADIRCRGMNRGLPEVQPAQGGWQGDHDQSGSGLPARSERVSLIMFSRGFGMRLEGQVRRTCASFGRAKQDLRSVVSCWES